MKLKRNIIITLLFAALFLTGCSAFSANSWPGVTYDSRTNTVYVAFNTNVFAVDAETGTEKWRFPTETNNSTTFFAAPAPTGTGQVIIGSYNKILYSVDEVSGNQVWTFPKEGTNGGATNRYIANPLVYENIIYAPNADHNLYALDLEGNTYWDKPFQASQALWAAPTADSVGKTLFITSLDRNLYAIDAETGETKWTKPLEGASVGTPKISDNGDLLFIGDFANQVISLELTDGKENWKLPTSDWIWSGPGVQDDLVFAGDLNGSFYAINRESGSIAWQVESGGQIVGGPLVTTDSVYFGTEAGTLFAYDISGNIKWQETINGNLYSTIVGSDNLVIVGVNGGDVLLQAYDQDGNPKWSFSPTQ